MPETKPALVLHLISGGDPLVFTVPPEDSAELERNLHLLVEHGSVETIRTKDGEKMVVNFAHVAVAYIEDLMQKGQHFGLR
ncbi:hypothetical protein ORV05_31745 [Amycolatopsis cynarae]|uniref:Uncharacterized protein n=2 Tax=Amycolatopsis TaxID=1813 RepID=A0A558BGN9_9PSEU|nr:MULTISPECIES: hypothetical protein [Amycolatopsis]TVT35671.1 hypothetical protein FNH05_26020 [Amycolatopsis rhizosphaerae]WAL65414.1 hypothetical protein ORV05_31745 [Amycolatopsis sp. HUAS 11-8]